MTDGLQSEPDGVLRALVYHAGFRIIGLAVEGGHQALEPFAAEAEGCDWDAVNIVYEDQPPQPPGPGLWVMTWQWRSLTDADERERDELCCHYIGKPSWERLAWNPRAAA